jgi:hypothetical protein
MAATPQFDIPAARSESARVGLLSEGIQTEETSAILERARAGASGLEYAGNVTPSEALELLNAGVGRLVDVRTPEERKFVGYVPDSVAVPNPYCAASDTRAPCAHRSRSTIPAKRSIHWFPLCISSRPRRPWPIAKTDHPDITRIILPAPPFCTNSWA